MKAAVVRAAGEAPGYGEIQEPEGGDGLVLVSVAAAALTLVTRARASGTHYSSTGGFPLVPGLDGVGRTEDGRHVAFLMPEAPFGSMAERTVVGAARVVPIPDGIDDALAAALVNPGMTAVGSLRDRAELQAGETVLINGATGAAGGLAVQVAKHLGARRVVALGRDTATLERLEGLGADRTISLRQESDLLQAELRDELTGYRPDVVIDYLAGPSTEAVLTAIAGTVRGGGPIRYVLSGGASGQPVVLQTAMLAPVPVSLMGNGIGALPFPRLVQAAGDAVEIAATRGLEIDFTTAPLREVREVWGGDGGRSRVVLTVEQS